MFDLLDDKQFDDQRTIKLIKIPTNLLIAGADRIPNEFAVLLFFLKKISCRFAPVLKEILTNKNV